MWSGNKLQSIILLFCKSCSLMWLLDNVLMAGRSLSEYFSWPRPLFPLSKLINHGQKITEEEENKSHVV